MRTYNRNRKLLSTISQDERYDMSVKEQLLMLIAEFDSDFFGIKEAAEYQGKEVKLNDPIRNPAGSKKKFRVYVMDPKTKKVRKIQFGDPEMEIKRDDPERRKSFRSRHKCKDPGPKTKARYWSCYQWRNKEKVDN